MIYADAKCKDCKLIFEISKKRVLDNYVIPKCPQCHSKNVYRMFTPVIFDMAEGSCGNEKTGYSTSVTYHPSIFGRYKGTKIK